MTWLKHVQIALANTQIVCGVIKQVDANIASKNVKTILYWNVIVQVNTVKFRITARALISKMKFRLAHKIGMGHN